MCSVSVRTTAHGPGGNLFRFRPVDRMWENGRVRTRDPFSRPRGQQLAAGAGLEVEGPRRRRFPNHSDAKFRIMRAKRRLSAHADRPYIFNRSTKRASPRTKSALLLKTISGYYAAALERLLVDEMPALIPRPRLQHHRQDANSRRVPDRREPPVVTSMPDDDGNRKKKDGEGEEAATEGALPGRQRHQKGQLLAAGSLLLRAMVPRRTGTHQKAAVRFRSETRTNSNGNLKDSSHS